MDRPRTRESLHRELQELLAASKDPSKDAQRSSTSSKHTLLGAAEDSCPSTDRKRSSETGRKTSSDLRSELPVVPEQDGQLDRNSSNTALHSGRLSASLRDSTQGATTQDATDLGTWASAAKYKLRAEVDESGTNCWPRCHWLPFKASHAALRKHPCIWITSVTLMLLLTAAGLAGVLAIAAQETQDKRIAAHGFAINAALAFERQLSEMFGPLLSLSAIIRFNPSYAAVNATFPRIAKELHEQMPTHGDLTTLIAAPQGVLSIFYPMEGYCTQDTKQCRFRDTVKANLFRIPERRDYALKTVRSGALVMQGPTRLFQGYFGIVGRQPVFVSPAAPNETWGAPDGPAYKCDICYNATTRTRFWGFVQAVVNLDGLVNGSDSRIKDLENLHYLYRMYKTESYGPITIAVSNPLPHDPVVTEISLPGGGVWTLEISPEAGWVPVWRAPILAVVVLVSCLFGLLLGAILVSSRLQSWLQVTIDALNQEKERMDVLLARQYNLINCVLQQEGEGDCDKGDRLSMESRTQTRIEQIRREIGVTTGTTGVDELHLTELIDEGTYGKVFKGIWRGSVVAVKTMVLPANMSGAEKRERMAIMEAAISSAMNHPNIVQTYTYIIKPCSSSVTPGVAHSSESSCSVNDLCTLEAPESSSASIHNFEVSLILEFCDWGSLKTALDAGAFFAKDNSLNYAAILETAADVARAMMHLHKHQVLHSDLKVGNILLKSDASGRGCVAKVADFGLAVRLDPLVDTHVSAFQGTMSHMAPEALLHGRISKAADMYSFGITLWELFTGGQVYQGIPHALVGHKVAVRGLRPTLPLFTPPDFRELIEQCWQQEPEKRPTFEAVLSRLVVMRQALGIALTPPLQPYKMRVRERGKVLERQSSSEQGVAIAAAKGLMHLGSYYMSSDGGTTIQPAATSGSTAGSSSSSGRHDRFPSGHPRLMNRTRSSQLERISDTEELEMELQQELVEQEAKDMLHSPQQVEAVLSPPAQTLSSTAATTAAAVGEQVQAHRSDCCSSSLAAQEDARRHQNQQRQQRQPGDIEQGNLL